MQWKPYSVNEQIKITHLYSLFKGVRGKEYSFEGETHPFWECVYVVDGSICASADDKVYNMSAGELIFHKPLELHKLSVTCNKPATIFIFSFSAEGELCNFFEGKVFYLSNKQRHIIENLIAYMQDKLEYSNPEKDLLAETKMYLNPFETLPHYPQAVVTQIYSLFFSLYESSDTLSVSTSHSSVIFSEAVSFMSDNICDNPSITEVARQVGISQAGLKNVFRKYAGMGVHKYFLKLKLKTAAEMLTQGISVTETAEKLGFSSQGYFTKCFKREMDYLPSEITKNRR